MAAQKPRMSCEFFPPKTGAGIDKLLTEVTPALNALGPEFHTQSPWKVSNGGKARLRMGDTG